MQMTFNQYIQNPMGKRSAVYTQTEVYRQLYSKKLNKLMVREGGVFNYVLYTGNDDYYIHMKVPSEVIEKFYYDVVVRFYTDDNLVRQRRDLNRYYVQFYSNDPAFVFTFAHAFRTNNMFIESLKGKISKEAIKKKPKERNPDEIIGYVKSIFFCYLIMESRSLFDKVTYEVYGKTFKKKEVLDNIMHADDKIRLRQEEDEKRREKERRAKRKVKKESTPTNKSTSTSSSSRRSSGYAKTAKRTSSTKKTKRI